jgi:hypothetical protein
MDISPIQIEKFGANRDSCTASIFIIDAAGESIKRGAWSAIMLDI